MHPLPSCAKRNIVRIAYMNGKQMRRCSVKICSAIATKRIIPPTVAGRASLFSISIPLEKNKAKHLGPRSPGSPTITVG